MFSGLWNQSVSPCISIHLFVCEQNTSFCQIQSPGKGINPFTSKPLFLRVSNTNLLKTLGKGEIACNKQFLAPLAEGQRAIVMAW